MALETTTVVFIFNGQENRLYSPYSEYVRCFKQLSDIFQYRTTPLDIRPTYFVHERHFQLTFRFVYYDFV